MDGARRGRWGWGVLGAFALLAMPGAADAAEPVDEEPPAWTSGGRARGPLLTVLGGATIVGGATLAVWDLFPRSCNDFVERCPGIRSWTFAGYGIVGAGIGIQAAGVSLWRFDRDGDHEGPTTTVEDTQLLAAGGVFTGLGAAASVAGLAVGYLEGGARTADLQSDRQLGSPLGSSLAVVGATFMATGVPLLWLSGVRTPAEQASLDVGPTSARLRLAF